MVTLSNIHITSFIIFKSFSMVHHSQSIIFPHTFLEGEISFIYSQSIFFPHIFLGGEISFIYSHSQPLGYQLLTKIIRQLSSLPSQTIKESIPQLQSSKSIIISSNNQSNNHFTLTTNQ